MSLFVAKSDITRYTGKRKRDEQVQELARKGIKYDLNSRGELIVLRSEIERILAKPADKAPRRGHNFGALK